MRRRVPGGRAVKLAAVSGAQPRAVVAAVVLVVVIAVVVLVASGGGGNGGGTNCSTFRVTPDLWGRASYDRRLQLRQGLEDCHRVKGRPDTEVVAQLGPPDGGGTAEMDYNLTSPGNAGRQVWRIRVGRDGKGTSTRLDSAS